MNKNGSRLLDNRKQKIIVSITGIFLVLMILVGLTYAYFLTKITGNTNEKSISVTTANLVLEYGENTNVVQGISNAEPGYEVSKIFTATNKGNSTVAYGAALESIVNELSRQEDLVYTLTCTSYLKEGFSLASDGTITGTIDGTCSGVSTEKQFPNTSTMSVMTTNTIDTLHTQAYKLTVIYKEKGIDQSTDMNKTFSAKVNIVDLRANADKINPYSANKKALNYQIINSALEGGENRTTYGSEVTTFTSISEEDEKVLNTAPDDYGTSYYYRGNVLDNYVKFADKTWRIVRINGDGTIRLILDVKTSEADRILYNSKGSTKNNAYVGYMYGDVDSTSYNDIHENISSSTIKDRIDSWYENNLKTNYSNYLADTLFCGDKTVSSGDGIGTNETTYSTKTRIEQGKPTLKCAENASNDFSRYSVSVSTLKNGNKTNGKLQYPIALLNGDELMMSGGAIQKNDAGIPTVNQNFYLNLKEDYIALNTMSPSYFKHEDKSSVDGAYIINYDCYTARVLSCGIDFMKVVDWYGGSENKSIDRPVVNLKSDIHISGGNGTKENPYVVE